MGMYTSRTSPSGKHLTFREGYRTDGKRPSRLQIRSKRWKHEDLVRIFAQWLRSPSLGGRFTVEAASDELQARKGDISRAMQALRLRGFRFEKFNSPPHDIHRYPSAYAKISIERGFPPSPYNGSSSSGWRATVYGFKLPNAT